MPTDDKVTKTLKQTKQAIDMMQATKKQRIKTGDWKLRDEQWLQRTIAEYEKLKRLANVISN